MERVHADGVSRRFAFRTPARRLKHPQLRLKLRYVSSVGVESLTHSLLVIALLRSGQVLDARERSQRNLLAPRFLCRHLVLTLLLFGWNSSEV
jgi:hypothetical protein